MIISVGTCRSISLLQRPAVNTYAENSTCLICCGFVVQRVVQQTHNKSNKLSQSFRPLVIVATAMIVI